MTTSRRRFLVNTLALGCSAAASPLVTPVTFAAAPWDARLVVIILRGGMDGLDVVRPVGDRGYLAARPDFNPKGQLDLNGFYTLHPALAGLRPMWQAGELSFAHATSTPYRDKRSHFDGQDLLEAGVVDFSGGRSDSTGWLNRMMTLIPGVTGETAFAVGQEELILLSGDAPHSSWAPGRSLLMSPQGQLLLQKIYEQDPLFHASAETAIELSSEKLTQFAAADDNRDMADMMAQNVRSAKLADRAKALARFSAKRLNEETRLVGFSIGGWDTHRNQARPLNQALGQLEAALLTLKADLGANWQKTAVLCMTEFGRTVRLNGSAGSDHGTGGAMIMAGGAIKGGQIMGDWPGLAEADLYDRRDLMPTSDVRGFAARAMQGLFGLGQSDLERVVFPSLDMADVPQFIA